jgi:hypothetical protein
MQGDADDGYMQALRCALHCSVPSLLLRPVLPFRAYSDDDCYDEFEGKLSFKYDREESPEGWTRALQKLPLLVVRQTPGRG